MKSTRLIVTAAVVWCALSFAACAGRQRVPLGDIPQPRQASADEIGQTRAVVKQLADETGELLPPSSPQHRRVQTMLSRLARAASAPPDAFPLYVLRVEDDVNAMAVNNNSIVVYSSLLQKVPDDDELATVLSHEVAHILARHGDDNSADERGEQVSLASTILGSVASIGLSAAGQGGLSSIAGDVTETATSVIGTGAFVRAYDRELETEADQVGLMLMAKAGYDPQAALRFWEKSGEIFGSTNSFSFLSTHPSSGDRSDSLKTAMPKAMVYYSAAPKAARDVSPKSSAKKKKK